MKQPILMIAAGMKKPKKQFNPMNELNLYLNYGLLGLATILYNKGYENVKMIQGDYKNVDIVIQDIKSFGIDIKKLKYPVFISVPSFISLSWAEEMVEKIKKENREIKIIFGGRWVVDNNINWLKERLNKVDFFAKGYGDKYIEHCLHVENWKNIDEHYQEEVQVFNEFNYKLLYQYEKYQPCIEISRGCGRGCEFCLENRQKALLPKNPENIMKEAILTCKIYKEDELNFYFQAAIFNPTIEWTEKFYRMYNEHRAKFKWRFETRVDTLNKETLSLLSKSGLKVIDLGLESASYTQLVRMNKTKNIDKYLKKAEEIVKKAHNNNIWVKLNILLYPGENRETLEETLDWLNKNKKYIKGVSINPLIIYRNGEYTKEFVRSIEKFSEKMVDIDRVDEYGYTFIDLSNEIDLKESEKLSLEISREYMNIDDYFDLKSISYFSRFTDYEKLKKDIIENTSRSEMLPFEIMEE
ncbi:B12-binding domain-containing radical SAM protein [Clostridium ganghwense]|uniref:Radical SAM protein n=1 Tax=Clostridium ganghwense TaxID=312089 RepID=A0ABT4CP01_9CLOT|nr:radical SAM protein [Clostridium ganghwense]MCY6369956.1 radical SAM protein [Clostridium ganghwense]